MDKLKDININYDILTKSFTLTYKGKSVQVNDLSRGRSSYYTDDGDFIKGISMNEGEKITLSLLKDAVNKLKEMAKNE